MYGGQIRVETVTIMNALAKSFTFHETYNIRVEAINGEPWFCAVDVCNALAHTNTSAALAKHCREAGITKRYIRSGGQNRELAFINEGNLYRLIIKSRKPEAQEFESWVCDEVLPSIRKTGRYVHPARSDERLSSSQHNDISRIIWMMTDQTRYKQSWSNAIWYALRDVTNTPSPEHFRAEDVGIIASELKRIASVMIPYRDAVGEAEKKIIKFVVRKRQAQQHYLDAFERELEEAIIPKPAIPTWLDKDITNLLTN